MAESRRTPPVLTEEELAAERWAPVSDTEGRYEVSDLGRVRRVGGRVLNTAGGGGKARYAVARIGATGHKARWIKVHRMVAVAFGAPGVGPEINHINGNRWDNRIGNLEFVSHRENARHAAANLLCHPGERCHKAKLTMADVLDIRMRRAAGDNYVDIGRTYGTAPGTVRLAAIGRTWKTAPGPIAVSESNPTRGGNRKLTAADVRLARTLISEGLSDVAIAMKFGVNANTISGIATGRHWTYVA